MQRMLQGNRYQEHKGNQSYQGARQGRPYPIRKTTARRMVGAPLAGALVALLPIAQYPIPSTWRLACPRAMHPSRS